MNNNLRRFVVSEDSIHIIFHPCSNVLFVVMERERERRADIKGLRYI